jgi:hypothetical protein
MKIRGDSYLTPHFRASAMRCRCRRSDCDAKPMARDFMAALQVLAAEWAEEWGKDLSPMSARRCHYWNKATGGFPDDAHIEGRACEFWFESKDELLAFMETAEKFGFVRVRRVKNRVTVEG